MVDGATVRAHLEMAWKSTGFVTYKSELDNPETLPAGAERLWSWFLEMCHTERTFTSGFPLPLSSSSILAWCQLRGVTMDLWEVRAIRLLDATWLRIRNKPKTDAAPK